MMENEVQNKNGIMIYVDMSIKNQQNIVHMKKVMPAILAYVLKIVTLVNT